MCHNLFSKGLYRPELGLILMVYVYTCIILEYYTELMGNSSWLLSLAWVDKLQKILFLKELHYYLKINLSNDLLSQGCGFLGSALWTNRSEIAFHINLIYKGKFIRVLIVTHDKLYGARKTLSTKRAWVISHFGSIRESR